MNRRFAFTSAVALAAVMAAASVTGSHAADQKVTLALPAQSILFSPIYIAADKGYFKDEGLDVSTVVVAGPGTLSAVVGGSAQFGTIAGGIVLAAAAKDQPTQIVGVTQTAFSTEMVLSKDAMKKTGVAADAPAEKRGAALKGLTIGVDAVGGLPHSYLRYIAKKYGLDAGKDMQVTPLAPPAMVAALHQGRIDGFVFSQPFTLQAVDEGASVWFSGARGDLPELNPNAYNAIITKPGYCKANADTCKHFMAAINKALSLMKSKPDEALGSVKKVFGTMPEALLKRSFDLSVKLAPANASVTEEAMKNTVEYVKTSEILPADAKLPPLADLYDNSFNAQK